MLDELKSAKKVVGVKQLRRALNAGTVHGVVFKQMDNVVYAFPAPTGTVLLFR